MRWVAVATLVVVWAAAACGGPQKRAHTGTEEYLAGLRVEGNHGIETDDLLPRLALQRTADAERALDPFVLANDVKRIRGAYVRLGYFSVDIKPRLDRVGQAITVVFVITEGPRAKTRVELIGLPTDNPAVAPGKLRKLVELKEGDPFDYDVYDDAKTTLLGAIQDEGYAHAQVGATVIADKASGEAIARYVFDPGPVCTFGKIEISGAPGDLEDAVRARMAIKEGGTYSATALAKTQRALFELGRFSTVRVEPDKDLAATAITIKIAVAVGKRHEKKFGGGIGYEPLTWDFRARAGYSVAGCLDELTTCSIDLQPAITLDHDFANPEPKIRATLGLHRLDFLLPFVKANAELGYDYLTIEAYTYTGPRAKLGLETPITPWLLARVGYLWALYDFILQDAIITQGMTGATPQSLGIDASERFGVFQQSLVMDLRDSPVAPRKGLYLELRLGEGGSYAGGTYDYVEIVPDLRLYAPLGNFVLAGRARAGRFYGDAPPTELFYSGGATTQRGFNERRLAPTISGDVLNSDGSTSFHSVPVGGAVLAETGVELRTPSITLPLIGVDVGVVAFLDGGDVTRTQAEMNLSNLHWATGGGLRIPTPIGAVRIDLGYRLNRTSAAEPEPTGLLRPFAFHFGIGEAY